jgi:lipopolysaccharide/colanic/teichoic acid biosynthesis glycosyltransferase
VWSRRSTALAAPAFAAIALAIKLDSRRPVFSRQQRLGRDGHLFEVLNFCTMVEGAERLRAELEHRKRGEGLSKIADALSV